MSNSWRIRKYLYQAENICGLIWEREPKIVANGSDNGLQRLPASFDKNLPQMAFNRKLSSRGVNINQLEQKEVYVGGKIAAFRWLSTQDGKTQHISVFLYVILWSQEGCWLSKNMCRLTSILVHYNRKITKYFHGNFRQFGDDDKRGSVVMLMSAPCHPHVNYITSQPAPDSTLFHQILLNSTTF